MRNDAKIGQAIERLTEGNKRLVSAKQTHPNQDKERRSKVAKGQKPFAIIVSFSDSRIPRRLSLTKTLATFLLSASPVTFSATWRGSAKLTANPNSESKRCLGWFRRQLPQRMSKRPGRLLLAASLSSLI
jgi:hypothetical protein